jgi:hypothetical protein
MKEARFYLTDRGRVFLTDESNTLLVILHGQGKMGLTPFRKGHRMYCRGQLDDLGEFVEFEHRQAAYQPGDYAKPWPAPAFDPGKEIIRCTPGFATKIVEAGIVTRNQDGSFNADIPRKMAGIVLDYLGVYLVSGWKELK